MNLVPPDSPLRLVPTTLDRKAVLYFDGIRYSLHIFELAATRLAATLNDISQGQMDTPTNSDRVALAVSDAWMLIDTTHRLRELIEQAPRLRKKLAEVQLFLRRTAPVEPLRHHFQHFRTGIDSYAKSSMPLWGTLSWVHTDHETGEQSNHSIAPGTFFDGAEVPMCTYDTYERKYVERVLLQAGPLKVDLAPLVEQISEFATWYTEWFRTTFPDTGHHGADVHFRLAVRPARQSAAASE